MRKTRSRRCLFLRAIFWIYILVVLYVVFLPIYIPDGWPENVTSETILDALSRVNGLPFFFGNLFTAGATVIFEQLTGNILPTLPFGFLLPFLMSVPPRHAIVLGFFAGVALEGAQLLLNLSGIISRYGHSIDVNDVIFNALGVLVGYGCYRLFIRLICD